MVYGREIFGQRAIARVSLLLLGAFAGSFPRHGNDARREAIDKIERAFYDLVTGMRIQEVTGRDAGAALRPYPERGGGMASAGGPSLGGSSTRKGACGAVWRGRSC